MNRGTGGEISPVPLFCDIKKRITSGGVKALKMSCVGMKVFLGFIFLWVPFFVFSPCGSAGPTLTLSSESLLLAFGDSITYGTGAPVDSSYPVLLEAMLGMKVINSGVPGETISEGLERLPGVLEKYSPRMVILCEGGNDLLRGREEDEIERDLRSMVSILQERDIDVMVIGVPSTRLTLSVPGLYRRVARDLSVLYEGKILRKVLSNAALKSDYIHPNGDGYRMMAEKIAELIEKSR